MTFRLREVVFLIFRPDQHKQDQSRIREVRVADAVGATLATGGSWRGEADLAKSPRLADYRMPVRISLNRELEHTKIFIIKPQCLAAPLERLGDNEPRSAMHHHAATSGPMSTFRVSL